MILTDDRLVAALDDMAGRPDAGSLVADVLRAIDSVPQRRQGWLRWGLGPQLSPAVLIALLLLTVAIAGTIAVGSGLIRLPWLVTVPPTALDGNGDIALRADGCTIVSVAPDGSSTDVLTEGFPGCYPTANSFDLAWSPDGRRLAMGYSFFCGGCGSSEAQAAIEARISGLWLMDVGTATFDQIVDCDLNCAVVDPKWSPDGSQIAYRTTEPNGLWIVSASGGPARAIELDVDGPSVVDFAWSPDSSYLALARSQVTRGGGPSLVTLIRADGDGETTLWDTDYMLTSIDWSPGGTMLAIAADQTVATLALTDDGAGLRATNGSPRFVYTQPGDLLVRHVRWSPDGSRIAWAEAAAPQTNEDGDTVMIDVRFGTMGADGADRRIVFEMMDGVGDFSRPIWSPDGEYLTFGIRTGGQTTSYVTAAGGSVEPQVIDELRFPGALTPTAPAWRPVEAPYPAAPRP